MNITYKYAIGDMVRIKHTYLYGRITGLRTIEHGRGGIIVEEVRTTLAYDSTQPLPEGHVYAPSFGELWLSVDGLEKV
jgi:hypothetical protein